MSEGMGDSISQLRDDVAKQGWIPGRGDYGADHSTDLVELIEEHNCVHGCVLAGAKKVKLEFGPGGDCHILAMVSLGDPKIPIPELDPRPAGPHCKARVPLPERPPVQPRPRPGPAGLDPLF